LNSRERFIEAFNFRKIRPPKLETLFFWDKTVDRWHNEGIPHDKTPQDYLNMDKIDFIPKVSHYLLPAEPLFERKIIEDTDDYMVYVNERGVVAKEFKKTFDQKGKEAMPQWLEFPVKNRKDFEDIKWRLDPENPTRYPNWNKTNEEYKGRDFPLGMMITGGYAIGREFMGMEHLALTYYDNPKLVKDMISYWLKFEKKVLEIVLANIDLDFVYIWEDMAYKNGPLISPSLFNDFILDSYKELIKHIKDLGCPSIIVDSDGDNYSLLPIFIESGVNGFLPVEVAAGMDPMAIMKKHGRNLMLWGGIDKRVLSKGKKEIEEEVVLKVPPILELGGFIPAIDHGIPPDVSLENYSFFVELLRSLTGKYE
jgi:uroporphyrinogen decarboxylase